MSNLTEEQLQKIEAKRQEALQRKRARERVHVTEQQQSSFAQQATSSSKTDGLRFPPVGTFSRNIVQSHKSSTVQSSKWSRRNDIKTFQKTTSLLNAIYELSSKDRFVVNVPFDAQIIEVFKSIPSRSYDQKTKQWSFHLRDHDRLTYELRMLRKVNVEPIPGTVLKLPTESLVAYFGALDVMSNISDCSTGKLINKNQQDMQRNVDLTRIDPVLLQSLIPFQEEGIRFGISKGGRCLLADDMGLGKTIQALGIAHYYKQEWPLLVVAPSSVRYVWAESIQQWLPSIPSSETAIMTSSKDSYEIDNAQIIITSYNLMTRNKDLLKKKTLLVIIMDESHYLKSCNSQRSIAAMDILKNARRVIMLTGTPALSRPQELFTQLSAIRPTIFSSMMKFGVRYCAGKHCGFGWDFSGASHMTELKTLLESHVMIRRIKSAVISQLPSKIRQVVILDPHLVQSKSKEMTKSMKKLKEENLSGLKQRGALLEYYFATAKVKLKAIREHIEELLEKGKKFICFAHHQLVLNEICSLLASKDLDYIRIDGNTESMNRKRLCDKFQLDEKCIVAVLSITAASTGITLTAAYLVVFAELYWNPGILTQAEDRAHRIGQTDSVLVQYLVAKDTADDYLWPLIQSKHNILNKVGLSKDNTLEAETTILQSEKHNSTILKYFKEIADLNSEEENELLANMDLEEIMPKQAKLSD